MEKSSRPANIKETLYLLEASGCISGSKTPGARSAPEEHDGSLKIVVVGAAGVVVVMVGSIVYKGDPD